MPSYYQTKLVEDLVLNGLAIVLSGSVISLTTFLVVSYLHYNTHASFHKKRHDLVQVNDPDVSLGKCKLFVSIFTGNGLVNEKVMYKTVCSSDVNLRVIGQFPGKLHCLQDGDLDESQKLFAPKCREQFLITEDRYMGRLKAIILSTTIAGPCPFWKCKSIIIRDALSNEAYFFDGQNASIKGVSGKVFDAASDEELTNFWFTYYRRLRREWRNGQHIYISFWNWNDRAVYNVKQRLCTAATSHFVLLSLSYILLMTIFMPGKDMQPHGIPLHEALLHSLSAEGDSLAGETAATIWFCHIMPTAFISAVLTSLVMYFIVLFFREKAKYETHLDEMDYVIATSLRDRAETEKERNRKRKLSLAKEEDCPEDSLAAIRETLNKPRRERHGKLPKDMKGADYFKEKVADVQKLAQETGAQNVEEPPPPLHRNTFFNIHIPRIGSGTKIGENALKPKKQVIQLNEPILDNDGIPDDFHEVGAFQRIRRWSQVKERNLMGYMRKKLHLPMPIPQIIVSQDDIFDDSSSEDSSNLLSNHPLYLARKKERKLFVGKRGFRHRPITKVMNEDGHIAIGVTSAFQVSHVEGMPGELICNLPLTNPVRKWPHPIAAWTGISIYFVVCTICVILVALFWDSHVGIPLTIYFTAMAYLIGLVFGIFWIEPAKTCLIAAWLAKKDQELHFSQYTKVKKRKIVKRKMVIQESRDQKIGGKEKLNHERNKRREEHKNEGETKLLPATDWEHRRESIYSSNAPWTSRISISHSKENLTDST